ncbi:transmembrane channel-like protein 7 isoform X1 [Lytechinus variegatus]|uniref:transmembrane channel-like protein 7 isoform X1 n=1 Tax=Lytechinus variegatus TaxID=7654 RepID=UPI001BB24363|nr:transmembrane channel-like protein 7 isoform X1 [Lytechinus variegatus]
MNKGNKLPPLNIELERQRAPQPVTTNALGIEHHMPPPRLMALEDQELDKIAPNTDDLYGSGSTKQASNTPATVTNIEVEEELKILDNNNPPPPAPAAAASMSNANGRPLSRARPVSRVSLHHGHIDAAVEYEMNKYKDDFSEDAMEKRAKVIKSVPATLDRRRSIRNKYGKGKLKALSGWKAFKYNVALKWKRTKENLYDFRLRFEVWRSSLKEVEGKFGTAVVSYFVFLKWLLFLNIYIFFIMFGFIVIPELILGTNYMYNPPTNCELAYTDSIETTCQDDGDGVQCILDFLEGSGWMEQTPLFYGNYSPEFYLSENSTIPINPNIYNLPLAYLLATISYFVISLLMMVNYTAKGFKDSMANREDTSYKYCNQVFAGWDYSLTDFNNCYLKHRSIHYEIATALEEERLALKRAKRTTKQKCKLYFLRIFLNLLVLLVLAGAGYLIYFTTDFAVLNSSKPVTTDAFASLLISYLPSITITLLNGVVPMIFNVVVRFEDYSPQFEISITLIRTVFLRLASLVVLFLSLYPQIVCPGRESEPCDVCPSDLKCWETYIGREFYKLTITDFAAVVLVIVLVEFPRKLAAKYCHCGVAKALGQMEFEIPKNVLAIVYSQALCWVGSFYSPLLPAICVLKCFIFFYFKKWSLLYNMVPSSRPFRATRSGIFFMVILLVTFLICLIPIGYSISSITPSAGCGPFRGHQSMWGELVQTIDEWDNFFEQVFEFIGSAAFVVPLIIILLLALYYYHAISAAHKEMVLLLKEQLIMEGRDKHFLLARLNELDPTTTKGHQKSRRKQIQNEDQRPPRVPSDAWSEGGPTAKHPFAM